MPVCIKKITELHFNFTKVTMENKWILMSRYTLFIQSGAVISMKDLHKQIKEAMYEYIQVQDQYRIFIKPF